MSEDQSAIMQQWREVSPVPGLSEGAQHYVDEIRAKREHAQRKGKESLHSVKEFMNAVRECAVLISSAKADLSPAQFKLAQAEFGFSEREQQGLLDFGRKFPEPITDAREALRSLGDAQMALGLLPYAEGHGPQTLREHNFALEITKLITSVRAGVQKQLARQPIGEWSPGYAQQFVSLAKPLATDFSEMVAEAERRAAA